MHSIQEGGEEDKNKIAIVLSNINGSNSDTYSRHTIEALYKGGFRTVFSHWRNAKLDPECPKPKNFNSFTHTEDVDALIKHVHECYPDAPIYLVGLSQGGQMFIRWAAEHSVSEKLG